MSANQPNFNELLASALQSKNLANIFHLLDKKEKLSLENILKAINVSNDLGGQFYEHRSTFEIITLVFQSPSIDEMVTSKSREILTTVLELGDLDSLKLLMEKFHALAETVKTKIGPFETAAQYGHEDVVKYLWEFPEIQKVITPNELDYILEGTEEYAPDKVDAIRAICALQSSRPRP